jgi:hypothetical protein
MWGPLVTLLGDTLSPLSARLMLQEGHHVSNTGKIMSETLYISNGTPADILAMSVC